MSSLFSHTSLPSSTHSLILILVLTPVEATGSSSCRSAHVRRPIGIVEAWWRHHLRTQAVDKGTPMLCMLTALGHHLLDQMLLERGCLGIHHRRQSAVPLRWKHVALLRVLGKIAHLVRGRHEGHLRHALQHRHLVLHVQAVEVCLLHLHSLLLLSRRERVLLRFEFRLLVAVRLLRVLPRSALVGILLSRQAVAGLLAGTRSGSLDWYEGI